MKHVLALAILLGGFVSTQVVQAAAILDREMARPEGRRHYIVVQPQGIDADKRPVVILLHGHGASAAMTVGLKSFAGLKTDEWVRLAEREKVLLIAPDGEKGADDRRAWNDCRGDATTNAVSDDVGFISALIDVAIADFHADPDRIYVFGSSNGGAMAYRLGIEIAPRLAAIGVQSATMPAKSRCAQPTIPLPVFVTHGTSDRIVPYAGGEIGHWTLHGRGTGLGVDESVAIWRKLARLPDTPTVYRFPHLQAADQTAATRVVWGSDGAQAQMELLRIDGGGHVHSSKTGDLPWLLRKLLGEMNHDVDSAEEAWSFFKGKRVGLLHR
jgi:polyhydroxybutyrate depolymerase